MANTKKTEEQDPEWRYLGSYHGPPFTEPSNLPVRQRLYVQKNRGNPLLKVVLESGEEMLLSTMSVEELGRSPRFAGIAQAHALWLKHKREHGARVPYRQVRRTYERYLAEAVRRVINTVAAYGQPGKDLGIGQLVEGQTSVRLVAGDLTGLRWDGRVILDHRTMPPVAQLPLPDIITLLRLLRRCRGAGPIPERVPADDIHTPRTERSERFEYWYKRVIAGYTGNRRLQVDTESLADSLGVNYEEALQLRELFRVNYEQSKEPL